MSEEKKKKKGINFHKAEVHNSNPQIRNLTIQLAIGSVWFGTSLLRIHIYVL